MKGRLIIIDPASASLRGQLNQVVDIDATPELEVLQRAVGGSIEGVPHWDSIEQDGARVPCVAFCNEDGKAEGLRTNDLATCEWEACLQTKGMTLMSRAAGGGLLDYLVGPIVVITGDDELMASL